MPSDPVILGPYPPPFGGVAIFTKTLFESVAGSGVKLWAYGNFSSNNHQIVRLNPKRLHLLYLSLKHRRRRIADSSHFLLEYPGLFSVFWIIAKILGGFQWIKIVHDGSLPDRYRSFGRVKRSIFHMLLRYPDRFITIDTKLMDWFRNDLKVKQPVIYISSLLPIDENSSANLNLPAHSKKICSVGAFLPSYGFLSVAESVENLRKASGLDIGLILIDGMFANDNRYRDLVLKERPWITCLEALDHHETLACIRACDLMVRATERESYGLCKVESILCGTPVVATRTGETRGMILYNSEDQKELIEAIQRGLAGDVDISPFACTYREEAVSNLVRFKEELLG
jgi:glycosyltransferase involved in cell wall biosynthesis